MSALPTVLPTALPTSLQHFHPAIADWFQQCYSQPTPAQKQGWQAIQQGHHTLIAAPTGSGKTLAAFLVCIDSLVKQSLSNALPNATLPDATTVVYISPLRALSNDIQCNLQAPLAGIAQSMQAHQLPITPIRAETRNSDTSASRRVAMLKKPPHILVTTPESLYLLLTSKKGRQMLSTVEKVIVDEIHALIPNKRGSHLALSLERLANLTSKPLQRIGLSATQRPLAQAANFLVGCDQNQQPHPCKIINLGHTRPWDIAIEVPDTPLSAVMSHDMWTEIYARLVMLINTHQSTLIFVNTRNLVERLAKELKALLGEQQVGAHHGSLSKTQRLQAEKDLKAGSLSVLVATASLELGIDIGAIDLVCQIGSTRSISVLMQRIGRAGHHLGGISKGRIFPLTRDELVESTALLQCVHSAQLDQLIMPSKPLDVLAQQLVAESALQEGSSTDLFGWVRRAYPYATLERRAFDEVLQLLTHTIPLPAAIQAAQTQEHKQEETVQEGIASGANGTSSTLASAAATLVESAAFSKVGAYGSGRGRTYLYHDQIQDKITGKKGSQLSALLNGGAIPETGLYEVLEHPSGMFVGSVHEDFAIECSKGDIFQLGNTSWQIVRVSDGKVHVLNAYGLPPTIPFWFGEAPARSNLLSQSVSQLRAQTAEVLTNHPLAVEGDSTALDSHAANFLSVPPDYPLVTQLQQDIGLSTFAAMQLVEYLGSAHLALQSLPTQHEVIIERFFDEGGGMQLVLHSAFGARVNRAWGLALRKCFCRKFNFELQAAANEDALVLSLGATHSFPLEEVFSYLHPNSVKQVLTQAVLDSPLFPVRWRQAAGISLAVPRRNAGRKVPLQIQRMRAEDLLSLVFPDQIACLENLAGEREIPDHPLVKQTLIDCLEDAMDIASLERILGDIRAGRIQTRVCDLTHPSPLAQEILSAKPYAFLDDAPLEERRTRAVSSRHLIDPKTAATLGALDPDVINAVRKNAWPPVNSVDSLHEALLLCGIWHLAGTLPAVNTLLAAKSLDVSNTIASNIVSDTASSTVQNTECQHWFQTLFQSGRAVILHPPKELGLPTAWAATEWCPYLLHTHAQWKIEASEAAQRSVFMAAASADSAHVITERAVTELLRTRLALVGPATASSLSALLAIHSADIQQGLLQLEQEGYVMQGHFTPNPIDNPPVEWCERGLLMRIHRQTLQHLRNAVRPVPLQDFMRFLFTWQGLTPHSLLHPSGIAALLATMQQLEGFEAPASAWESDLLPIRLAGYDPKWLDDLCLNGDLTWIRLSPALTSPALTPATLASPALTPPALTMPSNLPHNTQPAELPQLEKNLARKKATIAFPLAWVPRAELDWWQHWTALHAPAAATQQHQQDQQGGINPDQVALLSADAKRVLHILLQQGALFETDIIRFSGLLPVQTTEALQELVAWGWISCDSFAGLRALLGTSSKGSKLSARHKNRSAIQRITRPATGRWQVISIAKPHVLLPANIPLLDHSDTSSSSDNATKSNGNIINSSKPLANQPSAHGSQPPHPLGVFANPRITSADIAYWARLLLRRYGIVFKKLLDRESAAPPWSALVSEYRRMEASGEVSGGRFVEVLSGEQYALKEAVPLLRKITKQPHSKQTVVVNGTDPCHLTGLFNIETEKRVSALRTNRILYEDGKALAVLSSKQLHWLAEVPAEQRWEIEKKLHRPHPYPHADLASIAASQPYSNAAAFSADTPEESEQASFDSPSLNN